MVLRVFQQTIKIPFVTLMYAPLEKEEKRSRKGSLDWFVSGIVPVSPGILIDPNNPNTLNPNTPNKHNTSNTLNEPKSPANPTFLSPLLNTLAGPQAEFLARCRQLAL